MQEHLERAAAQAGDLAQWLRDYRSPVEEAMTEEQRKEARLAFEAAKRREEH